MTSKIIILFALVGALTAIRHDAVTVILEEGDELVAEVIKDEGDKEIIETSAHGNRVAVTYIRNCKENWIVELPEDDPRCWVRSVSKDDGKCGETKDGLKKTGGHYPDKVITEINRLMIAGPLYGRFQGNPTIREACKGRRKMVSPMMSNKKHNYNDAMRDIEAYALKMAKESKTDARKRAILKEFMACTNASTMKIMTCPGDQLFCKCKVRKPWCTYFIKCPLDMGQGGFNCGSKHSMESPVCCDYNC